jgi:hypothetical protein
MQETLTGLVKKLVALKGFGEIVTDAHATYFFHIRNTRARKLPPVGTVVRFNPVPVQIPGKNPRAINVEAL